MIKSLSDVTAKDLMQKRVITLPQEALVREAISIFEDEHITGIPVVDDSGNVVGMLSEHDVARTEHMSRGRIDSERDNYDFAESDESLEGPSGEEAEYYSKEDYSAAVLGESLVKDWMHSGVVSVTPGTGLKEICETMTREGVHRVLVLDRRKLKGIVSTVDVVRHLARVL